jgi:predicted esterase
VPLAAFEHKAFFEVLKESGVDLITPTARKIPYTPCGGELMTVWYDRHPNVFRDGNRDTYEDRVNTQSSIDQIINLINLSSDQYDFIFVGGLSMGGGLALHLLSQSQLPPNVKGIFSLGSFVIESTSFFRAPGGSSSPNTHLPVLMMHGTKWICALNFNNQCCFRS